MGLFDKIKSVVNQVAGTSAKVTLTAEASSIKGAIKVNITAVIKDKELPINKVYLYVRSVEKINIPKQNLPGGSSQHQNSLILESDVFQKQEFTISAAETLEANKTYNWSYELTLPAHATPSFSGKYTKHIWQFYAGLDSKGNDPDSGWVDIELK